MVVQPDALRRAFGREVRTRREARGFSQEKLAFEASLSLRHISELERGGKMPSLLTVVAIARALGSPPGELVDAAAHAEETRGAVDGRQAGEAVDRQAGHRSPRLR